MAALPSAQKADVLLISEGAYPYISGGVSSWVQTIVSEMPEKTFSILFVGARAEDYEELKYELPKNVVDFRCYYLFDHLGEEANGKCPMSQENIGRVEALHDWFKNSETCEHAKVLHEIIDLFDPVHGVTQEQFSHSEEAWDFITQRYQEFSSEPSFMDYFWTVKNMHSPMWHIARWVHQMPAVKLIHTVSTGYAGFLGAMIKSDQKVPLVLTEHGIYTKERRIELMQSAMVKFKKELDRVDNVAYLRSLWIRFFESLALTCYEMSDQVIALYHGTSQRQTEDGADKERQLVVPNGVDIEALKKFRHDKPHEKRIICLLGRVVPIKDIKTFIRSIKYLSAEREDFDVWIVGPTDENKEYAQECLNLVEGLDLTDKITFKGKMPLDQILPEIDLMVLSSISEGMPLVVLEGFAAGVPAVSTNVGSCSELIVGVTKEDKEIGEAGRMVKLASPKDLAQGMAELMEVNAWQIASQAAIKRVEAYFSLPMMMDAYKTIYSRFSKQ